MKYLFISLIILPLGVFAQLHLQISGDFSVTFLPSTAAGRGATVNSTSTDNSGVSFGAELWFPGKSKKYNYGLYARYGRVFSTRLQGNFSGPAAGATPESNRIIFAQTKLQGFDFSQLGASAKIARFSSPRFDWSFQAGGGVSFIPSQRLHVAGSEFHSDKDRLQTPGSGYEIDSNGIRESASFVNSITLLDDMLLKVTPFLEIELNAESPGGIMAFLSAQIGLRPVVDPDLYQGNDLNGLLWFQIRTGAKGRLF